MAHLENLRRLVEEADSCLRGEAAGILDETSPLVSPNAVGSAESGRSSVCVVLTADSDEQAFRVLGDLLGEDAAKPAPPSPGLPAEASKGGVRVIVRTEAVASAEAFVASLPDGGAGGKKAVDVAVVASNMTSRNDYDGNGSLVAALAAEGIPLVGYLVNAEAAPDRESVLVASARRFLVKMAGSSVGWNGCANNAASAEELVLAVGTDSGSGSPAFSRFWRDGGGEGAAHKIVALRRRSKAVSKGKATRVAGVAAIGAAAAAVAFVIQLVRQTRNAVNLLLLYSFFSLSMASPYRLLASSSKRVTAELTSTRTSLTGVLQTRAESQS